MKVETFEQQTEQHPEACDEARRLIAELGLDGQKQALTETGPRCPYRQWMKREQVVYQLLCPTVDKPEDYEADTIPLRVLQVMAHAKSLGVYEGFRILSAANPAIKDPVLVGLLPGSSWDKSKWHLLARWGAELDEFPAMERKAAAIHKQKLIVEAAKAKGEAATIIERLQNTPDDCTELLDLTAPQFYAQGW